MSVMNNWLLNIFPVQISTPDSPDYAEVQKHVREAVGYEVCKSDTGAVSSSYVLRSGLAKKDGRFPVIIYKFHTELVGLGGFLLLRIRKNGGIYIDVVCSGEKGVGKLLIQRAITWGREMGHSKIQLSSLGHVEDFYKRFGFRYPKEGRVGDNIGGFAMQKNLTGGYPQGAKDPRLPNWRSRPVRTSPRIRKAPEVFDFNTPPLPGGRPRMYK